jgi:hypothetical protein
MTKPMIRIHDVSSNEIIDREMTDEEFAQYQIDQLAQAEAQALKDAHAAQKVALLDRLGITAEEAALLLG